MNPFMPDQHSGPPLSDRCEGLTFPNPPVALLSTEFVTLEGTITTPDEVELTVAGQTAHAVAGRFELNLQLPDGQHAVDVQCDRTTLTRQFSIQSGRPRFVVDSLTQAACTKRETAN